MRPDPYAWKCSGCSAPIERGRLWCAACEERHERARAACDADADVGALRRMVDEARARREAARELPGRAWREADLELRAIVEAERLVSARVRREATGSAP